MFNCVKKKRNKNGNDRRNDRKKNENGNGRGEGGRHEIRILLLTFVRLLIYFRSSVVIGIAELQQRERERKGTTEILRINCNFCFDFNRALIKFLSRKKIFLPRPL